MAQAALQSVKEKYDVQVLINQNWTTQMTFDLDQRHKAVQQAEILCQRNPGLPVRVIFDSYNNLNKHHNRAIIYKHKSRQETAVKIQRIPLGFWEYVGAVLNAIVMSVAGALAIGAVVHFTSNSFSTVMEEHSRQLLVMAVSGGVLIASLYMTMNYVRQRYVMDAKNRKPSFFGLFKWGRRSLDPAHAKGCSPIDQRVQQEMSNAARAIAYMPVNDHQRKIVSDYEKMPRGEVVKLFQSLRKTQKKKAKKNNNRTEIHTFLLAVLKDSQAYMKTAKMKLTGENRIGFALYFMGLAEQYLQHYALSQGQQDKLLESLFAQIGILGEAWEDFLFDYETRCEDPIDQSLIVKGGQIAQRLMQGNEKALRDVSYAVQQWKAACREREEAQCRQFILTCEWRHPSWDVQESDFVWPLEWGHFLAGFAGHVFEGDETHLLLEFADEKEVLEAAIILQEGMKLYNEGHKEDEIRLHLVLTHECEDEILGESAYRLLPFINGETMVLSPSVYQALEHKQSYILEKSILNDLGCWQFTGFQAEELQDMKSETSGNSGKFTSFPDFS